MPKPGERAAQRERAAAVLDLYASGLSLVGIARRLTITPAQAQRRLAEAIASMPAQDVDELRASTELRLDKAAETYGALLDHPDPRTRLQAAAGLATVERDRVRLLGTYQKPPKDEEETR